MTAHIMTRHLIFEKRVENYIKIGKEYGKKGPTALGRELGLSRQRVQQIASQLRKAGIKIPVFKSKVRVLDVAVQKLLNDSR